jgi:hypothetical protein
MAIIEELADDLSNLDVIISAYSSLLNKDLKTDISLKNKTLQFCNQEQPSIFSYYDQLRVEIEILNDYIEIKVKETKMKVIRLILEKSDKTYGERMLERMADDHPAFIEAQKKLLKVRELYMKAKSAVDSLQQRGYSLNNITKIRVAGIEETIIYDE